MQVSGIFKKNSPLLSKYWENRGESQRNEKGMINVYNNLMKAAAVNKLNRGVHYTYASP